MLKYIPIIALLIAGCARTTTMPMPGTTPTQTHVEPADSMPKYVAMEPIIPDGPKVYTGDDWELRAPAEWKRFEHEDAEIVLKSDDRTVKASLIKRDMTSNLETLLALASQDLVERGASLATKRTGFVNTRATIQLEFIMEDNIGQVNLFATGKEVYLFTCVGKESTFDHNLILCNGLLRGLYIGHAP